MELIAEGRGAVPSVSEHLSRWKSLSVLLDGEDGTKSMRPNPKAHKLACRLQGDEQPLILLHFPFPKEVGWPLSVGFAAAFCSSLLSLSCSIAVSMHERGVDVGAGFAMQTTTLRDPQSLHSPRCLLTVLQCWGLQTPSLHGAFIAASLLLHLMASSSHQCINLTALTDPVDPIGSIGLIDYTDLIDPIGA